MPAASVRCVANSMSRFDEHFMRMALREAEKAAADGEVPLGCVIVAA